MLGMQQARVAHVDYRQVLKEPGWCYTVMLTARGGLAMAHAAEQAPATAAASGDSTYKSKPDPGTAFAQRSEGIIACSEACAPAGHSACALPGSGHS